MYAISGHLWIAFKKNFLVVPILAKINKSVNYNLAVFFQNMDFDTIDYCGCGLTTIYLKLCMQVEDTHSY